MTPAQAAWLRKLRDEGPQALGYDCNPSASTICMLNGWTEAHHATPDDPEIITPAGIAALEAYERNKE